jgi:hypothetical protein
MAWSCALLGYKGELPEVLLQHAVRALQDGSPGSYGVGSLSTLCWSAAVLDLQRYAPQVLQLAAACQQQWALAVPANLRRLYHVHLWLLHAQLPSSGQAPGLQSVLSEHQLQQCKDSYLQRLEENKAISMAYPNALDESLFAAAQAQPEGTWQHPPVSFIHSCYTGLAAAHS